MSNINTPRLRTARPQTDTEGDMRVVALAALAPLGTGVLLLLCYAIWGSGGAVFGALCWLCWLIWWHNKHKQFFPREARNSTVFLLALLTFGLLMLLVLIA